MNDKECVNCLESICKLFVASCKNCEGQALELLSAIRYAIGIVQSKGEKND